MPQMDGVTAMKQIRAMGGPLAHIPIIALTANAMVGDRETYIAAGADGYVSKPIEPADLFRMIARVTGQERSGEADAETALVQAAAPSPAPLSPEAEKAMAKALADLDALEGR